MSRTAENCLEPAPAWKDRKSTRLNSSHSQISYAVFCLKKKNRGKVLNRCGGGIWGCGVGHGSFVSGSPVQEAGSGGRCDISCIYLIFIHVRLSALHTE